MEIIVTFTPEQLELIEVLLQSKYKLLKPDSTNEIDPLNVYETICSEALSRARNALYVLHEDTPIKKHLSAHPQRQSISDAKRMKLNTLETLLASI
ncbi:MAG: hypothetical protein M3Q44_03735 [bacterium]|nr:hypothetical protein [bacterium]